MSEVISTRTLTCRSCEFPLTEILSLGDQYITDWVDVDEVSNAKKSPLDLALCLNESCRLVQLKDSVDQDFLFRSYFYSSGINQTMREALSDITDKIQNYVPLSSEDIVVDIGCNDGTLLRTYPKEVTRIGFDPALNFVKESEVGGNQIIPEFFSSKYYHHYKKASIVTAIAMFYDLDDPHSFIQNVEDCLDEDGVFVVQMSYLPIMLSQNAFDNICHEHVTYYSLKSFEYLLKSHNLKVFDAELNNVNGGSIRLYLSRNRPESAMLHTLRSWENEMSLDSRDPYDMFSLRCRGIREKILDFLEDAKSHGKIVYGYAASTKGNVFLQYCGITPELLPAIADRNSRKWGKICVGSDIPVISEEEARRDNPDFFLILAWAFADEFVRRESKWRERGGQFIIPLPQVKILPRKTPLNKSDLLSPYSLATTSINQEA